MIFNLGESKKIYICAPLYLLQLCVKYCKQNLIIKIINCNRKSSIIHTKLVNNNINMTMCNNFNVYKKLTVADDQLKRSKIKKINLIQTVT